MIKSMTGYGRCEAADEKHRFTVEMKSVNNRYLDMNIRMPRRLNALEASIRSLLKERLFRGKVDIFISMEDRAESSVCIKYNATLAAEYVSHLKQMAAQFGLENDIQVSALSRYPEVFSMEEIPTDEDAMWPLLKKALLGAADQFLEARTAEGAHLFRDLNAKLDDMLIYVAQIETRSPEILTEYRQKITEKVSELLGNAQIEESRIASEVILFADKICTDEETVRLKSHIQAMKQTLTLNDSIGRKLDFLAQEMNREANTILSKANDLEISDLAIALKTEIEKVREQIQNIE